MGAGRPISDDVPRTDGFSGKGRACHPACELPELPKDHEPKLVEALGPLVAATRRNYAARGGAWLFVLRPHGLSGDAVVLAKPDRLRFCVACVIPSHSR